MRWLTSNIPVLQRLLVFILFFESGSERALLCKSVSRFLSEVPVEFRAEEEQEVGSEPYDGQHIIIPMVPYPATCLCKYAKSE